MFVLSNPPHAPIIITILPLPLPKYKSTMIAQTLAPAVELLVSVLKSFAALSRVGALPGLVAKVPVSLLLAGHCLAVAGMTKGAHGGRIASYVLVRALPVVVPRASC